MQLSIWPKDNIEICMSEKNSEKSVSSGLEVGNQIILFRQGTGALSGTSSCSFISCGLTLLPIREHVNIVSELLMTQTNG